MKPRKRGSESLGNGELSSRPSRQRKSLPPPPDRALSINQKSVIQRHLLDRCKRQWHLFRSPVLSFSEQIPRVKVPERRASAKVLCVYYSSIVVVDGDGYLSSKGTEEAKEMFHPRLLSHSRMNPKDMDPKGEMSPSSAA